MKKIIFVVACIFTTTSRAQILQGHYSPFGAGYAHQTVKDHSLSPVSYSGGIAMLTTGYYFQNKNWRSILDLTGFGGFQHPDVNDAGNDNSTILLSGRVQYSLSRRIHHTGNWTFFAGLLNHNIWDFRQVRAYSNSSANYNGYFSIGGIITTQYDFNLFGESFGLQYALGLPATAFFLRPGYIKPFGTEYFGEKGWAGLGEFILIDSRTDLYWALNEFNFLRLSYQWEYSSLDRLNKIQTGTHLLSLSTIIKF